MWLGGGGGPPAISFASKSAKEKETLSFVLGLSFASFFATSFFQNSPPKITACFSNTENDSPTTMPRKNNRSPWHFKHAYGSYDEAVQQAQGIRSGHQSGSPESRVDAYYDKFDKCWRIGKVPKCMANHQKRNTLNACYHH